MDFSAKRLIIIVILILFIGSNYIIKSVTGDQKNILTNTSLKLKGTIEVNELFIFGRNMNFSGEIDFDFDEVKLGLVNRETEKITEYQLMTNGKTFTISDEYNKALNLDELEIGEFRLILIIDGNYYNLVNYTEDQHNEYYSMSNIDIPKKVIINANEKDAGIDIKVIPSETPEDVYDIVIDPGHGGAVSGTAAGEVLEKVRNLEVALKLKSELEQMGYKIKLTRDGDYALTEPGFYNECPAKRTSVSYETKSKYTFSLHANGALSSYFNGIEIYAPNNIDYTLARNMADSLVTNTSFGYSNLIDSKIYPGVYVRYMSQDEIDRDYVYLTNLGIEPYPTDTTWLFNCMLREVGGKTLKSFYDSREEGFDNEYRYANHTTEPYIIEFGYASNPKDDYYLKTEQTKIVKSMAKAIDDYLK